VCACTLHACECVCTCICVCVCVINEFTIAVKLGLIQSVVGTDKEENVTHTCQLIREAVTSGAEIYSSSNSKCVY